MNWTFNGVVLISVHSCILENTTLFSLAHPSHSLTNQERASTKREHKFCTPGKQLPTLNEEVFLRLI